MLSIKHISKLIFSNPIVAILLLGQLTLSMVLVSFSLSVIEERVEKISRHTGMVDGYVYYHMLPKFNGFDLNSIVEKDLKYIAQQQGVKSVSSSYRVPLIESQLETIFSLDLNDDGASKVVPAHFYGVDQFAISAAGLKLIEGRNFNKDEVYKDGFSPKGKYVKAILSKQFSNQLFEGESAVGKKFREVDGTFFEVVGVVEYLVGSAESKHYYNALLIPDGVVKRSRYYWVGFEGGDIEDLASNLHERLIALDVNRNISKPTSISKQRNVVYKKDIEIIKLFALVIAALSVLCVFASYAFCVMKVQSRAMQFSLRFALGASRSALFKQGFNESFLLVLIASLLVLCFVVVSKIIGFEIVTLGFTNSVFACVWLLCICCAAIYPALIRGKSVNVAEVLRGE